MNHGSLVDDQYEAAAELSEGLRCALSDVKRFQLQLPGHEQLTTIQVDASRQTLQNILTALINEMAGKPVQDGFPVDLSASLIDWITMLRRGTPINVYTLSDIRERVEVLPTTLTDADFDFLDQLLLVVDAHASHLFYRLPVRGAAN